MHSCACDAKCEWLEQNLIVPGCLVVWVQKEMNVRVNQARKKRSPSQIDPRCSRRGRTGRSGIRDGFSGYDDDPTLMH
jgi:hypothetical protein